MDKNRLQSLLGRTSEPVTAKSAAVTGRGPVPCGGAEVEAVGLTSCCPRRSWNSWAERAPERTIIEVQKSPEDVLVS